MFFILKLVLFLRYYNFVSSLREVAKYHNKNARMQMLHVLDQNLITFSAIKKFLFYLRKTYGFPKGMRPVWLEEINCNGTESHIDDCKHSGWVKPKKRLSIYNLAGVMCNSVTSRVLVPPVAPSWGNIDVSIRELCYVFTVGEIKCYECTLLIFECT